MLKVGHVGHVTEHALFIIWIELCAFEVFLKGGDCSFQDIVDLLHLGSIDLPIFGTDVSEAYPNYGRNVGV